MVADSSDTTGERRLRDGVETVAVDHRRSVQPDLDVVDVDFRSETTNGGGDLGYRHGAARVEHLGSGQQLDGPLLPTKFGQPHLAASRRSPPYFHLGPEGAGTFRSSEVGVPVSSPQGDTYGIGDFLASSHRNVDAELPSALGQLLVQRERRAFPPAAGQRSAQRCSLRMIFAIFKLMARKRPS